MTGTIDTGDVALTKTVTPSELSVGDIVTFKDPSRNGELVTHRVARMKRDGDTFAFITKGDANTGRETWSINARGKLGKYVSRIPRAGYALAWFASRHIRIGLLIGGFSILALAALRRIWR
jgi:signal peptidase I